MVCAEINQLIRAERLDDALHLLSVKSQDMHPLLFSQKHLEILLAKNDIKSLNKSFVDFIMVF